MFPLNTKILCVDDYPIIRRKMIENLQSLGFKGPFLEASSAEEAISSLDKEQKTESPVGIVFSDWNMPGEGGLKILDHMRQRTHYDSTPFILITSLSYDPKMMKALRMGITSFLPKPWAIEDLKERLEDAWLKHMASKKKTA